MELAIGVVIGAAVFAWGYYAGSTGKVFEKPSGIRPIGRLRKGKRIVKAGDDVAAQDRG